MIYNGIMYETKFDANFVNRNWEISYTLIQSRKNQKGINEERELMFKIISSHSYSTAHRDIMSEVTKSLSQYGFDLFEIPASDFLTLKERLENGKTENNQITKN
jgi:hypothetical protein